MVAGMTDDEIWALNRGGHDPVKIYAAYSAAVRHTGQPTVILAKTVKGYGMGESGEGQNITHQQKHMADAALAKFRDRFSLPLSDEQLAELPFLRFDDDSEEMAYLRERRAALGGYLPARRRRSTQTLAVPELSAFGGQLGGTPGREISTTMAFVRILNTLLRDKSIGPRVVPIVPDESRTFGMEGMFRQFGIFSQAGQLYQPEDANQLMYYREAPDGQMLQEGINEAGAMASWIAAATAYSTSDIPMIPFYIFYSMFGFQRVMDLIWAAGDSRARGFLLGGTAGRTTLNGEGLQHEDGHSHVLASVVPNCVSYDPTYSYEVAVIVHDGLRRMLAEQEDVFFYITLDERELRASRAARGRRGRDPAGHVPAASGFWLCWRPGGAVAGQRDDLAGGAGRRRPAGRRLRRGGRRVERAELHRTAARRARHRAVEHAAPDVGRRGAATWRTAWPGGPARSSRRPTTSSPSPTRSAPSCRGATGCWGLTATAVRTTGATCAASSRSTGTTSPWPRWRRWPRTGRSRRPRSPTRSRGTASTRISRTRRGHEPARTMRGAAMSAATEVSVPDLGDFADVPVIEIHVAPGDVVSDEDPLITLESDKATMDIPSPARRHGPRAAGQGRRPGQPRVTDPAARHRGHRRRAAAADRPAGAARRWSGRPGRRGARAGGSFGRGGSGGPAAEAGRR